MANEMSDRKCLLYCSNQPMAHSDHKVIKPYENVWEKATHHSFND